MADFLIGVSIMKIGILSRDKQSYSTTRLQTVARNMGHAVVVMNPFDCYLHIEGRGYKIYHCRFVVDNIDVLIPRLSLATARYGLEVIEQFEWAGVQVINSAKAISNARNKFRSLRILAANGIPVPPTFTLGTTEFLSQAVKRTGRYPFIIKPFEGTQGRGIMLLDTQYALSSALDAMCDLRQDYIVQPFIAEAAGRDIRALVIGGKLVGAMQRKARDGEFRANIHRGGEGTLIELDAEYEDVALESTAALQLDVAGVDMLQSKNGPLVLEVNPSPGFEGLELATGLNIAKEIIKYAVSRNGRKDKKKAGGQNGNSSPNRSVDE